MYKITDCHIYIDVNQESIDNLVEEMRATPLGTSWTVERNLGSQLIFTGVHGCMLNDMIANRQLVDNAVLWLFYEFDFIV